MPPPPPPPPPMPPVKPKQSPAFMSGTLSPYSLVTPPQGRPWVKGRAARQPATERTVCFVADWVAGETPALPGLPADETPVLPGLLPGRCCEEEELRR